MNNSENPTDPLNIPFIAMGEGNVPLAGDVFEGPDNTPARLEIVPQPQDTTHIWHGYIKVTVPGTHYFRIDADSSITLSIPAKNFTMIKSAGTLNTALKSVYLDQKGYYYCEITHHHYASMGYPYEGCVALVSTSGYPLAGTYRTNNTGASRLAAGAGMILKRLYIQQLVPDSSSSSSDDRENPEWGFSSSEEKPDTDPKPDPGPDPSSSAEPWWPWPGPSSSAPPSSSTPSSSESSSSCPPVSSSESSAPPASSSESSAPPASSSESSASPESSSESSAPPVSSSESSVPPASSSESSAPPVSSSESSAPPSSSESSSESSSLSSEPSGSEPSGESSNSEESSSSDPPSDEEECPTCTECDKDCSQGDGEDGQRIPFGDDQNSGECEGSGGVGGNPDPPPPTRSRMRAAGEPIHCGIPFRYDSPMEWTMTYHDQAREAVIKRPSGRCQYYKAAAGSATGERQGMTRRDGSLAQYLNRDLTPCTEGMPAYVKVVRADGSAQQFSVATGKVVEVTTKTGATMSAEAYANSVQVTRDSAGEVTSVWSLTQGLLQLTRSTGHLDIEWYAPKQVSGNAQSGWITQGDPVKTYSYTCRYDGAVKVMDIINQQNGQTTLCIERRIKENNVTIIEGEGDERIVTTYERNYLPDGKWEEIKTVRGINEETPASCTRTIKKSTAGGWLVLSKTEGYGAPEAETTTYTYNEQYRVSLEIKPDGGYTRYEYDAQGRVTLEASPWVDSDEEVAKRTIYANQRFNDYRPAREETFYFSSVRGEAHIMTRVYTYMDTPQIRRTTIAYYSESGASQTEVRELYGDEATPAYARGRAKMSQAPDGVQQIWMYEETALYGAANKAIRETRVNGIIVPGRSERTVQYIALNGTVTREESYVHTGEDWSLIATVDYEYDEQRRRTKSTRGNGRVSTTEWMCCGPLREVDEDGVMTSYGYNTVRQLVETIRSATDTTPETIASFTRDAVGRVLTEGTYIGSMHRQTAAIYNRLGQIVRKTDELGRVTTFTYVNRGLKETVTLPTGAQQVTERNYDGSLRTQSLPGEYPLTFSYPMDSYGPHIDGYIMGTNHKIKCEIFDQFQRPIMVQKESIRNRVDAIIQILLIYNNKGQMIERTDLDVRTTYEYDLMGEVCREIQPLSTSPTPYNSPYKEYAYTYEAKTEGVYRKTTVTDYNAQGYPLTSTREELVSELSPTLESKTIETDIYGHVTTTWTEYNGATRRKVQQSISTSSITAETLVMDGFTVSQKDHAGVTTTWSRAYTATGSTVIQTDGRGNAVTEKKDIAGRTIQVTDAAGNAASIAYDRSTGQPSVLTDALGKTTCYKYDIYGRKTAEYGTAIQPACFAYDEASNMIRLTTFRSAGETITTDPSFRTDGDVTEWEYAWQEKVVLKKTYADGSIVTTQYGDMNRVASVTDAQGQTVTHAYYVDTGLLKSQLYSGGKTPNIHYDYNHLGGLVEIKDGSGTREITYDSYGKPDTEKVTIGGVEYSLKENYDSCGRSSGYELTGGSDTSLLHAVQGYGTDGRLATAGIQTAAGMQAFGYSYLSGTHLPGTLTMPGGVSRELAYEEHRDLATHISYKKDGTNIVARTQTYDALGRPVTRSQQRGTEAVRNDVFTYNDRSELTGAILGGLNYVYDYDNIGNRKTAQEIDGEISYEANSLNQYTGITNSTLNSPPSTLEQPFFPAFDMNGNQTLIHTETGVWEVTYNAANRPVKFVQGNMEVECGYDYMDRRWFKKVKQNGVVTVHECYLYRDYLQIAALDMLQNATVKHVILWDSSEPIATRPLALLTRGEMYMYGFDFGKIVTELLDDQGQSVASYDYTPYGAVATNGEQASSNPLQWSSEVWDEDLGMSYYNYRYLNSLDGRWTSRDSLEEKDELNLYTFINNNGINYIDILGDRRMNTYSQQKAAKFLKKQIKNKPRNNKNTKPSNKPTEYTPPIDPDNSSSIGRTKLEDVLDYITGKFDCETIQYDSALRQCDKQRSMVKCPKCCIVTTYCKQDAWREYSTHPSIGTLSPLTCSRLKETGVISPGFPSETYYIDL